MIRVHASHVLKMKEHLLYLEQQFSIINDVHGAKVLPLEKINWNISNHGKQFYFHPKSLTVSIFHPELLCLFIISSVMRYLKCNAVSKLFGNSVSKTSAFADFWALSLKNLYRPWKTKCAKFVDLFASSNSKPDVDLIVCLLNCRLRIRSFGRRGKVDFVLRTSMIIHVLKTKMLKNIVGYFRFWRCFCLE